MKTLLILSSLFLFLVVAVFLVEAAPVISNVHPADGTVDVDVVLGINVTARITGGGSTKLNVSIWSNHTGDWLQYAGYWPGMEWFNMFMVDFNDDGEWHAIDIGHWNTNYYSQDDGNFGFYENTPVTHHWSMTEIETKYFWSINASGDTGWTNSTYSFTSVNRLPPTVTNVWPANGATNVPAYGVSPRALIYHNHIYRINASIYTNASGSWTRVAGWPMSGFFEKFMVDVDADGNWTYIDLAEYNVAAGWQSFGNYGFFGAELVTDNWGINVIDTKYWWSLNVSDGVNWVNETRWLITVLGDEPPVVELITPVNESDNNLPYGLSIEIDISDILEDYQTFYWTIECSNDESSSGAGETSGRKFLNVSILEYSMVYYIWVNVSDIEFWTNHTYWFETVRKEEGLRQVNVTRFIPGSITSADMFFLTVPRNITDDTIVNVPSTYEGKNWWVFRETKTIKTIKVYGISEEFKFQEIYAEALSFTVHGIEDYKAVVIIPNPGFFQKSHWWFERLNNAQQIYNEYLLKGMIFV